MAKSIRISPKHGLNPSICKCFWCGQAKNELALLGRLRGDTEAPGTIIADMVPCDTCQENMAKGIALLAVTDKPVLENQPIATQDATGRPMYYYPQYLVTTENFVTRNYPKEIAENILRHRKCCMPKAEIDGILKQMQQLNQDESTTTTDSEV